MYLRAWTDLRKDTIFFYLIQKPNLIFGKFCNFFFLRAQFRDARKGTCSELYLLKFVSTKRSFWTFYIIAVIDVCL
jgi:hypothetical protein